MALFVDPGAADGSEPISKQLRCCCIQVCVQKCAVAYILFREIAFCLLTSALCVCVCVEVADVIAQVVV